MSSSLRPHGRGAPIVRGTLLSARYPRQEYCSGLPFPFPRDRPNPGVETMFPALQADSSPLSHQGSHIGPSGGYKGEGRSKGWWPEPIGLVSLKEKPKRLFVVSVPCEDTGRKRWSASQKEDLHQKRVSPCPDTELPVSRTARKKAFWGLSHSMCCLSFWKPQLMNTPTKM